MLLWAHLPKRGLARRTHSSPCSIRGRYRQGEGEGMTPPVSLSDAQLDLIVRAAGLLPRGKRCLFLTQIADCLKARGNLHPSNDQVAMAVQVALAQLVEGDTAA
jgi:hypothetical protein